MAVTTGRHTFGALLKYGGTPTTLGKLTSLTPNKRSVDTIDASHHGSTVVDKIADSLIDNGNLSFTCHYLSASLTAVDALVGTSTTWSITYPGGDVASFTGILTSFGVDELPVKGSMMFLSGEIEITGAITWTMA